MNHATSGPDPEPRWNERETTEMNAVTFLQRLGYHYLAPSDALALRGGKISRSLLDGVLRSQLIRLNRIHYKGREHAFSAANIRRAIQALEDISLVEGLQRAGELAYDLLRLGKSFEERFGDDTKSFSLRYIDWENPANNVFHVTTQFTLPRVGSAQTCRLDLVLFVNGIPFAAAECKASDGDLDEAISDLLAYQSANYAPEFFKTVQVLLALKSDAAQYATVKTERKFWAVWKSRDAEKDEADIARLLREPLPETEREAVTGVFVRERAALYAAESQGRISTAQDHALYNLCSKTRLLELAGKFILYDGGQKKIARYQQYDAVNKAMSRLLTFNDEGQRIGGVIWHTQGSGKSLTMVLLANAIAQSRLISNPRIVLVTDRIDLDKQIRNTFHRCGLEPHRATSGADLRRLVASPRAGVITTLVQKFAALVENNGVVDDSPDIVVLVDEGHRTQYGSLQAKMRRVFPNACYIGFTGTPILKADRNTVNKFGGMIDTYTMPQAVADKAVVPLLYERRHVQQDVNRNAIDTWFERICRDLSESQRDDLKRKYSRAEFVTKTEQRLWATAYDIAADYRKNWQRGGYFKAQVVAPDKASAIRLYRFLEEESAGRPEGERVSSAVIISPPEEREGVESVSDPTPDEVQAFWNKMMDAHGSEEKYNENIIAGFSGSGDPEILIVVDKLITGFDVPRNTVLYLTRRLAHHTLLQAIARVNRLYEGKEFGYILDYVGVLGELDRALTDYAALAGYDPKDIEGTLTNIQNEVATLPQKHHALRDLFKSLPNRYDEAAYARLLADKPTRDEFYDRLRDFALVLKLALSTERFYDETPTDTIERYRADLKRFMRLRTTVQNQYQDTVNMKLLEPQIRKLLDTYISSDSVEVVTPQPVNIFDNEAVDAALSEMATPAAQADLMAYAMERTLIERMDEDPARYGKFSDLLSETIQAFRDQLVSEQEYLARIRALREDLVTPDAVPVRLVGHEIAQAYYHIVCAQPRELAMPPGDQEVAADIALMIDQAIRRELVVDWQRKLDIEKRMRANIDDGFFALGQQGKITLDWPVLDEIATEAMRVAKSRL